MNLKAILVLFLLFFASAITISLISTSIAVSNIKPVVFTSTSTNIQPLGEIIDNPIAPS